jgi:hypothetical protein
LKPCARQEGKGRFGHQPSSSREYSTQRLFPGSAESGYLEFVLLLDIFADVASDTLAGEGLFAALRRQFVEDKRTTSLDVGYALERRRMREAAAGAGGHVTDVASGLDYPARVESRRR